jgi:hypothetical protein
MRLLILLALPGLMFSWIAVAVRSFFLPTCGESQLASGRSAYAGVRKCSISRAQSGCMVTVMWPRRAKTRSRLSGISRAVSAKSSGP